MARAKATRRKRGRPGCPGRYDHPIHRIIGATRFSAVPEMQDPVWFIREFKANTNLQLLDMLRAGTTVLNEEGRPRDPRDWALLYLGYVMTGVVEVRRFWIMHEHSPMWAECGFACRPSLSLLSLRFAELETVTEGFLSVASALIQRHLVRRSHRALGRHRRHVGREQRSPRTLLF